MILDEVQKTKNKRATARKYRIDPNSIRHWEKKKMAIMAKSMINPKAKTTNRGKVAVYNDLEIKLYEWFEEMQLEDIGVKSNNIIAQALLIDEEVKCNFYQGNMIKMRRWVYCWMQRYRLSIRRTTRVGQKLSGHLEQVRKDTIEAINKRFSESGSLKNLSSHFFLNMDQTAIYFEDKSKTSIQKRGAKVVTIRDSGSDAKRCTLVVTVAADGTKLPPFFIFKGVPGAKLEKSLKRNKINACCQNKGWFDETVTPKYIDTIIAPYVAGAEKCLLLVDHFKVHLMDSFVNGLGSIGVDIEFIPKGYTCVLQPVDVGFNAPLKKCQTSSSIMAL